MTDFLFDVPWWVLTGLVVGGIVVFWMGNKRTDQKMKAAGAFLLLLAVVWGVVSYLVETPREYALRQTKAIIVAYRQHDWGKLQGILDPGTTLAKYGNRNLIMAAAKASVDNPGVKDVSILSMDAQQVQTNITVTTTLWTTVSAAYDRPIRSSWEFNWVDMGGHWTLTAIQPVSLEGQSPEEIFKRMPVVGR